MYLQLENISPYASNFSGQCPNVSVGNQSTHSEKVILPFDLAGKVGETLDRPRAVFCAREPFAEILSVLSEGTRSCPAPDDRGRVARAFDLAGITNTVGAPFLRVLCEEPALSGAEGAGVGNAGARHQAI